MADEIAPNSEKAVVPVVGALGQRGYEEIKVTGNRLDNHTEALRQHRQIISYQARWSANAADVALWITSVAVFVRGILLLVQMGTLAPVYPLGALVLVGVPFLVVSFDTVKRYPALRSAFLLRLLYVIFGILISLV